MFTRDPKLIVLEFNECVNRQDIKGLSKLMSDDYVFIDSNNNVHSGSKKFMLEGWTEFFSLYPDYRNHFSRIESKENMVFVIGYSTCSFKPLNGPAFGW